MRDIGTLGGAFSDARAINGSEAVGESGTTTGRFHAFKYSGGIMEDLGTLGALGSVADGINDAGEVVGYLSSPISSPDHAFFYDGNMHDLGAPTGGLSYANAINNHGQIVGYVRVAGLPSLVNRAVLFEGGDIVDLNDTIPASSGWLLQTATAINDNGWIVGTGINPSGQGDSFLLTPVPEPCSSVLLCIGALTPLACRLRFRRVGRRILSRRAPTELTGVAFAGKLASASDDCSDGRPN
jgi:probable HAF family extracellular repeat protein